MASISAVTLLTSDMGRAVVFYRALGFHLLYGGEEAAFTSFRVGAGFLNLQLDPSGAPERAIWGRVVLWVDDVDAMYQRAIRAGFHPDTSPADAPWGERYFHIRDPSGHELSFCAPAGKVDLRASPADVRLSRPPGGRRRRGRGPRRGSPLALWSAAAGGRYGAALVGGQLERP